MKNAAGNIDIEEARKHLGDVARVSRRRKFIGDGVDLVFFSRTLDHRVDEARPIRTENPRNADHEMSILHRQNIFLPCPFRLAINAYRLGEIGFDVRLALLAVENVIGAEVNQLRLLLTANSSENFWCFRIDRKSLLSLRF